MTFGEEVKAVVAGLASHDLSDPLWLCAPWTPPRSIPGFLLKKTKHRIVTGEIEGLALPGYITEGRCQRVREVVVIVAISGIPQQLVIDREESGIAVFKTRFRAVSFKGSRE